ncbi:hypothetical protein E4U55_001290 [Claviceps digitariae]|nr:hypothetical protein E4U55_001290 [Claviceps digitariae]
MVRITALFVGVLALVSASEACGGWYQCSYSSGKNCCVIDSGLGPGGCPSHCDGGAAFPPRCIGQLTGNVRKAC